MTIHFVSHHFQVSYICIQAQNKHLYSVHEAKLLANVISFNSQEQKQMILKELGVGQGENHEDR